MIGDWKGEPRWNSRTIMTFTGGTIRSRPLGSLSTWASRIYRTTSARSIRCCPIGVYSLTTESPGRPKRTRRGFKRIRPEQRLLRKYIFPGGELDHIGHTIDVMESHGFRVHDVEGWRDHYALTCRLWCQRLWENRDAATRLVGRERFRLWLAYLGGVSLALGDGSACLFQTVTTKHASKGHSQMPPTRRHLYDSTSAVRRSVA